MVSILITGVSGVGKTTIAQKLSNEFGVTYLSTGDIIFEIASKIGVAQKREDLYDLPVNLRRRIHFKARKKIMELIQSHSIIILDDKLIIFEGSIIYPPPSYFRDYKVSFVILLKDNPRDILKRVAKDQTKVRISRDANMIAHEQEIIENYLKKMKNKESFELVIIKPNYNLVREIFIAILKKLEVKISGDKKI